MKYSILLIFLCCSLTFVSAQKRDQFVLLDSVLVELKEVTNEISRLNKLSGTFEVSIKLNDVVTKKNEFELKILIFAFKRARSKSYDNSFTSNYKLESEVIPGSKGNPTKKLSRYINSAINTYISANTNLIKTGFTIVTSFTLSNDGNASGSTPIIEPITIGANRSISKKSIHSVTLNFKPKPKKKSITSADLLKKEVEILDKLDEILKTGEKIYEKESKEKE